jgi:hypothetical protein
MKNIKGLRGLLRLPSGETQAVDVEWNMVSWDLKCTYKVALNGGLNLAANEIRGIFGSYFGDDLGIELVIDGRIISKISPSTYEETHLESESNIIDVMIGFHYTPKNRGIA